MLDLLHPIFKTLTFWHQGLTTKKLYITATRTLTGSHYLKGSCQNWASGMLPPKLGHILGCLAFTEFFLPQIKPYPGWITFWKSNRKSIFWLLNNWPKLFKKIWIAIWCFSFEICFRNPFLTSGSGQTENTPIRIFAYFPFDHILKSKIYSKSRFEMRNAIFIF